MKALKHNYYLYKQLLQLLTVGRISKLTTHHLSVLLTPSVITDSTPRARVTYLHVSRGFISASDQSNSSRGGAGLGTDDTSCLVLGTGRVSLCTGTEGRL